MNQRRNFNKRGWDKSPSLSIIFGLSSKTQWLSGLYYADFISFYSPTQLCGGGTTKSNSNELPISVPLSFLYSWIMVRRSSPVVVGRIRTRLRGVEAISGTGESILVVRGLVLQSFLGLVDRDLAVATRWVEDDNAGIFDPAPYPAGV